MKLSLRDGARLLFGWQPESKLSETAWLNGIRGLAAFLVMMSHFSNFWLSPFCEAPFGAVVTEDTAFNDVWFYHKGQRLWSLWRLPILRVFLCNGGGQVAIFFVVSGFVLTWSPLKLAQAGNQEKLLVSLGSSTFRRWFRLYPPCIAVNFIYMLYGELTHFQGLMPLLLAFWTYVGAAQVWANPFRTIAEELFSKMQGYNVVVWTIPHEFAGSMFVYVLALIVGRMQQYTRRLTVILLATLYAFISLKWDLWLFGTGMLMADYARYAKLLTRQPQAISTWISALWFLCILLGMSILSYPLWGQGYTRPPYDLTELIPLPPGWREHAGEERFWWGWAAILILSGISHLRTMRKFFELAILQHLGKISFMLYLIHGLMADVIGTPLQKVIYAAVCTYEDETPFNHVCHINPMLHGTILVGLWVITVVPVLIVAHILEVVVDRPITMLGKKVDDLVMNGFTPKAGEVKLPEQEHLLESMEELEMGQVPQTVREQAG